MELSPHCTFLFSLFIRGVLSCSTQGISFDVVVVVVLVLLEKTVIFSFYSVVVVGNGWKNYRSSYDRS